MKWIISKNNKPVKVKDIPILDISAIRSQIVRRLQNGLRMVSFFGLMSGKGVTVYVVLADDENSRLFISGADFGKETSYPSISKDVPAVWNFENEFYEEFGILPEYHPWLKPVRYSFDRPDRSKTMENFPFFKMSGEEVHEVAVGPIHAGVIEPGHFRFMCQGESVHHLEIQLGYQHRGVEKLFIKNRVAFPVHLAESIAGDTVIAHASAYAQAVEALSGTEISRRAQSIRAIALEMERCAIHIGDLGAIANDVAYLLGNSVYGATRTLVINSLLAICGSRFGRGLVRIGGVSFDINDDIIGELVKTLSKVDRDIEKMSETMFSSASVLTRLENTGAVSMELAEKIGLVGLAAKASGLARDIRADHPFGIYRYYPLHKITMNSGDVFARAYLRYVEIKQSINFIIEQLDALSAEKTLIVPPKKTASDSLVVSMTEGWRGEVVHIAVTGRGGAISKYKIKDPSFNNWFGLAQAVRKNEISDFPLCNKSFNLSYCGYDL